MDGWMLIMRGTSLKAILFAMLYSVNVCKIGRNFTGFCRMFSTALNSPFTSLSQTAECNYHVIKKM